MASSPEFPLGAIPKNYSYGSNDKWLMRNKKEYSKESSRSQSKSNESQCKHFNQCETLDSDEELFPSYHCPPTDKVFSNIDEIRRYREHRELRRKDTQQSALFSLFKTLQRETLTEMSFRLEAQSSEIRQLKATVNQCVKALISLQNEGSREDNSSSWHSFPHPENDECRENLRRTLNNQIPSSGLRPNNYWDNFRSTSHVNHLASSSSPSYFTSTNTNNNTSDFQSCTLSENLRDKRRKSKNSMEQNRYKDSFSNDSLVKSLTLSIYEEMKFLISAQGSQPVKLAKLFQDIQGLKSTEDWPYLPRSSSIEDENDSNQPFLQFPISNQILSMSESQVKDSVPSSTSNMTTNLKRNSFRKRNETGREERELKNILNFPLTQGGNVGRKVEDRLWISESNSVLNESLEADSRTQGTDSVPTRLSPNTSTHQQRHVENSLENLVYDVLNSSFEANNSS